MWLVLRIKQMQCCMCLISTRLSPVSPHEEADVERDYNVLCFISLILSFGVYQALIGDQELIC